jgi:L-ornithine N5-oxygenase
VRSEAVAVTPLAQGAQGYRVEMRDLYSGALSQIEVDAILLATGYEQPLVPPALATLLPWLRRDEDGGLAIGRDYRVGMTQECGVNLFVNGLSERTHGISDAQSFSLMAMRSERILDALEQRQAQYAELLQA